MKRILWCLPLSGLVLFACFGTRPAGPPEPPSSAVTTRIQSPPVERNIRLRTWQWGQRFYPADVASAYTVIVTSRATPGQFTAFGFDVKRGAAPFAVTGSMELRARFLEQIRRETASLPTQQKAELPMTLLQDPPTGPQPSATEPPEDGGRTDPDAGTSGPDGGGGMTGQDGGSGGDSPPLGGGSTSSEPPTYGPWVEGYAYALALMRSDASAQGQPPVEEAQLRLGAPASE